MLQVGFDGFARQATTVFTSTLRTVCQVTLTSVEQRSYAEYVDSLTSTTYLTIFSAEPMPGLGVLEIPLPAMMACDRPHARRPRRRRAARAPADRDRGRRRSAA